MNSVDKMTDRELTVLAAQAIGIKPNLDLGGLLLDKYGGLFDPLQDDGDALRTAVQLGFLIEIIPCEQLVIVWNSEPLNEESKVYVRFGDLTGATADDAYTATRRAIVEAAAALVLIRGKE